MDRITPINFQIDWFVISRAVSPAKYQSFDGVHGLEPTLFLLFIYRSSVINDTDDTNVSAIGLHKYTGYAAVNQCRLQSSVTLLTTSVAMAALLVYLNSVIVWNFLSFMH